MSAADVRSILDAAANQLLAVVAPLSAATLPSPQAPRLPGSPWLR